VGTNDRNLLEERVEKTARRLRLIQVDFADDSEQTRIEYLHEEIERGLKTLPPEQQRMFLERLLETFPRRLEAATTADTQSMAQSKPRVETEQVRDPDFIIRRIQEMLAVLSVEQQHVFSSRLKDIGLAPSAGLDSSSELAKALKAKLELTDDSEINPDQIAPLIALLTEFVRKLEPVVWSTWRMLSPRSSIRSSDSLNTLLGRFVCADASDPGAEEELQKLQRLIVAMITAIGRIGKQFGKQHLARFSPSEIAALVQMEQGSVFVSQEVKCWRKYSSLADTLTEDSIDLELRKAIADYAESLIKGLNR